VWYRRKARRRMPVFCQQEHGTKGGGRMTPVTAADGTYVLRHLWFGTFIVMRRSIRGPRGQRIEGVTLAEESTARS